MSTQIEGPVRVRFAPSPTGFLHVGGARTAIYNELLRRSVGGANILRIEDTDKARSDEAMIRQITSALEWIGTAWDEGPVLQSAGVERHRAAARQLLEEGKAYPCFVSQEELAEARKAAEKGGGRFRYRDTFQPPSAEEIERRQAAGESYAVRFRSPDDHVRFTDLVRGDVDFPPEILDDFIILRSDGSPTYHLSVVCDDIDMRVTHVIRGDDHLSNTPKHIPLFVALGAEPPTFCHLPLILGTDKKRLSKRVGSTSVEEFRDDGILPQALYNYLALLGWNPGDDREIMTREEMIEAFTVERFNTSAAVFDPEKLAWMNAQYLAGMDYEELLPHLQPFLDDAGLSGVDPKRLRATVELHQSRAKKLTELPAMVRPYFAERLDYDAELSTKYVADTALPDQLHQLRDRYAALDPFDIEGLETELRALADELEVKAGVLIHPTRMALSGQKAGPSLFDLIATMGRGDTVRHLDHYITYLRGAQAAQPRQEPAP